MWNFLRRGQNGVEAAATLDRLNQDLARVKSNLSTNQVVAANSYLIWLEEAERHLLAIFEEFSIPRQLHTDRYWRIRTMDGSTSRPMPLVRAEIEMQARYLDELLTQLKHYISLLTLPHDQSILVLDTNVYIHGKMFHEVDWHKEIGARRATLVMPLVVLDELDLIKDRGSDSGKNAQGVIRALDKLTGGKDWLNRIEIRQNVWLQLLDEPLGHRRQKGQDDEIVRQSRYFAQLNDNRLVLMTRDRGMRLRSQAYGLTGKSLADHLERESRT